MDGISRLQKLLIQQQMTRLLRTSEEAIAETYDDGPQSATVQGYSDGRMLLQFPGSEGLVPGGKAITSGAIAKGEKITVDKSKGPTVAIEGTPWVRPVVEEDIPSVITATAEIAVLFRRRDGANWQYYIAGLTETPFPIGTPIPIVREERTFVTSDSLSSVTSTPNIIGNNIATGDVNDTVIGITSFLLDSFYVKSYTGTGNASAQVTGAFEQYNLNYSSSLLYRIRTANFEVGLLSAVAGEINIDSASASNILVKNETDTPGFLQTRIYPFFSDCVGNQTFQRMSVSAGLSSGTIADDDVNPNPVTIQATGSGSTSTIVESLTSNDAWISYENGLFYVGIRSDYSTQFANVEYYSIDVSGNITNLPLTPTGEYQERKLDPTDLIEASSLSLIEQTTVTNTDFWRSFPDIESSHQGIPGLFVNPDDQDEELTRTESGCYWSKTGEDYFVLSDILELQDMTAGGRPITIDRKDPITEQIFETFTVNLRGWAVLSEKSYVDGVDGVYGPIGDIVAGFAIVPPTN